MTSLICLLGLPQNTGLLENYFEGKVIDLGDAVSLLFSIFKDKVVDHQWLGCAGPVASKELKKLGIVDAGNSKHQGADQSNQRVRSFIRT